MKLSGRILIILSAVAAFSTELALIVQDRTLSGDLRDATQQRLDGAVESTKLLIRNHLDTLTERYSAISGTPQFRANLEVGDAPTLRFYASQLAKRQGASLVAFVDPEGRPMAAWTEDETLRPLVPDAAGGLKAHTDVPLAITAIDLRTADQLVGRSISIETIDDALVEPDGDLKAPDLQVGPAAVL